MRDRIAEIISQRVSDDIAEYMTDQIMAEPIEHVEKCSDNGEGEITWLFEWSCGCKRGRRGHKCHDYHADNIKLLTPYDLVDPDLAHIYAMCIDYKKKHPDTEWTIPNNKGTLRAIRKE